MAAPQIPYEYQTSFGEAEEKEKLAQYLMSLAAQQRRGPGQMVGNIFVKTHPLEHLANVLSQAQAGWLMSQAGKQRREILQQAGKDQEAELAKIAAMMSGSVPQSAAGDYGPGEAPTVGPQTSTSPNPMGAVQSALMSRFPNIREFGKQMREMMTSQFKTMAPYASRESLFASRGDPNRLLPEPRERFGPIVNLAPPGSQPIYGTTSDQTNKPIFAPQPPATTTITIPPDEKWKHELTVKDYERLFGDKQLQWWRETQKSLSNTATALSLLRTTPINWGVDSDVRTFAQKLASVVGKPVDPRAPATELYNSFIVPTIAEFLKPLGAGTGVSDKDREFAERALALATRDPRAAEAALLFALRGQIKEAKQYENEVREAASVAHPSLRPHFETKIPQFSITFPEGVNLPDNIFAPGVLEKRFADLLKAPSSPSSKQDGQGITLSPEAREVIKRYLPR